MDDRAVPTRSPAPGPLPWVVAGLAVVAVAYVAFGGLDGGCDETLSLVFAEGDQTGETVQVCAELDDTVEVRLIPADVAERWDVGVVSFFRVREIEETGPGSGGIAAASTIYIYRPGDHHWRFLLNQWRHDPAWLAASSWASPTVPTIATSRGAAWATDSPPFKELNWIEDGWRFQLTAGPDVSLEDMIGFLETLQSVSRS